MGGDFAPQEVVKGAIDASRKLGVAVLLVGDQEQVEAQLRGVDTNGAIYKVVPSQGRIEEGEHPAIALRRNPNVSVAVATGLVKLGKAQAMVSMGSTGGSMAAATLGLGLLGGLERPCVGGPFLGGLAPHTAILDLGSNIDCRPQQMLSFAMMGCVFARKFFGVDDPKVALLSVGAEEGKGNKQVKEAYPLFKQSHLNFIGNVEGNDLFSGKAHVVVCDGFVGNVLLKFAESVGDVLSNYFMKKMKGKIPDRELQVLGQEIWGITNESKKSSGPLFGVNGNVIVGHGASKAHEVAWAVETAKKCVDLDLANGITKEFEQLKKTVET
jgi:glycerol-3-phosphate acyltransferase PlsX